MPASCQACVLPALPATGCLRLWELKGPFPTAKEVAARPTYLPLSNISTAQVRSDTWWQHVVGTYARNRRSKG